ncbi:MAG: 23S rRNA (pseudouridine(1915)-N(3))-methyltransferase RlmH [Coleofasciculaceae cyanobacterium SM2_3_26]|nr:23S rRNA (pseudouridine(1915)-N(3))-methyltransferase RlmH [Coleofasciculaceae cyanobacterium SM2_3_26]
MERNVNGFPKIKLIAVDKVKKTWIREGIELYLKRLPELEIIEIKDSNPEKEGEQILTMLKPDWWAIALTEEGKLFSSVQFANFLSQADSNHLVFIIGSAEGLSPKLKQAATQQIALSPLTFPHEIARLLLVEQLYRAKTILQGSSYHK